MVHRLTDLEGEIEIQLLSTYGDGIVWATFADAQGRRVTACIDGRKKSETRHRIFIGVRHPRNTEGRLIDLGSDEEGIFVSLISSYIDALPIKTVLDEDWVELLKNALLRIGTAN